MHVSLELNLQNFAKRKKKVYAYASVRHRLRPIKIIITFKDLRKQITALRLRSYFNIFVNLLQRCRSFSTSTMSLLKFSSDLYIKIITKHLNKGLYQKGS